MSGSIALARKRRTHKQGGNESDIPELISAILRSKGWWERRIKGDLLIARVSGSLPKDKRNAAAQQPAGDEQGKNGKPKMLASKYGASTTWMGKLRYRLDAGRHGGCPVLALGITRRLITDWNDDEAQRA